MCYPLAKKRSLSPNAHDRTPASTHPITLVGLDYRTFIIGLDEISVNMTLPIVCGVDIPLLDRP